MSWLEAMARISCDLLQPLQYLTAAPRPLPAQGLSSVVVILRDTHGSEINVGFSNEPPSPA